MTARRWFVKLPTGERIGEGEGNPNLHSRLDYFMMMFPYRQLEGEVRWTNVQLHKARKQPTTAGELIKYKGIQLLATRFQFNSRADLWSTTTQWCRYIPAPYFGRTGMSRQRFNDLTSCLRCSLQPLQQLPGETSETYCWKLVDNFVSHFNHHRYHTFMPSHMLCADESISRWYGLGGHWINCGLPQYVALDGKPHNGCESEKVRHGMSSEMMSYDFVVTFHEIIAQTVHWTEVLRAQVTTRHGVVTESKYYELMDVTQT